jgi:hypothetical protein
VSSPSTEPPPAAPQLRAGSRQRHASLRGAAAVRAAFRLLAAISSSAAAGVAHRLFFTPPRARVRDEDRAVLATARRAEHRVMGERVASYAWGSGAPVLLVHGWGGHAGHMAAFVEPLVRAGLGVVAVDLPGHGASGGRRSSLVHFAAAIEGVTSDLLPAPDAAWHGVVAHSLGAPGLMRALSRGVRARRVVAVAPPAHLGPIWALFRETLGVPDAAWARMRRIGEEWLDIDFDDVEPLRLAAGMTAPVLVLHDAGDREVDVAEGVALAGAWPGAIFRRTDGLGHVRILRDAATVREAVEFIAV